MNAKNIKHLDNEIELVTSIQLLAKAYEELAVMQMQRIRDSVQNNRNFTEELNKIYAEVKYSYRKKVLSMAKNKSKDTDSYSFSTLNKNGKSLALLITPDQRFSGSIAQKVFYPFYEYINTENCDVAVIGRVGKELFEQAGFAHSFIFIDIPSTGDQEAISKVLDFMTKYETVHVFYGKYQNLIKQNAMKQNLTGDELGVDDYEAVKSEEYLFEPSVEKILNFFEVQIFGTIFKQVLSEAKLARLGSRISAMEIATNNASDRVKVLDKARSTARKATSNKKQLQRISGISIWG